MSALLFLPTHDPIIALVRQIAIDIFNCLNLTVFTEVFPLLCLFLCIFYLDSRNFLYYNQSNLSERAWQYDRFQKQHLVLRLLLLYIGGLPVLLKEAMIRFFNSIGSPLFLHSL